MMTKYLLIIALALPISVFAQESEENSTTQGTADTPSFKSKNGIEVLPQAGDWALGINAGTALNYLGNIFSGGTGGNYNSNWWQYQDNLGPVVIFGKYFTSATFAYRAGVNLNFYENTQHFQVVDDNATTPDGYVEDVYKISRGGITLLAGVEKRKGSGRVQGVYGADVYVSFASNTKYSYEYGNAITATNQQPTFGAPQTNFGGVANPSQGYRNTELKAASNWGAGVQGFIGVEVFVFPKISLGGMFTWAITYTDNGPTRISEESWDAQSNSVEEYTISSGNGHTFNAGIGNVGGQVSANFYF